ncbi:PREDICTED: uncharacterized protein LOC107189341 [Dufourea novaeangliae]|uniref:uncharacterized protein LOC107189341 n=1 Tax=Dufourea novaeangliae TaxID=178035 RepID=UPI0007673485|nr:PREDICTED: uncharacterized protein LOC107189341 [Dufourea novaeangliae]
MFKMDDLEQQCEDALFELCDARERYPLRCADELRTCIQLRNEIQMMNVTQKSNITNNVLGQSIHFDNDFWKKKVCLDFLDHKLQEMIDKLGNLKTVMEQIEREKTCKTNILLKS